MSPLMPCVNFISLVDAGGRGGDYWTSLLRENSHKLLLVDGHRGKNEERDFFSSPSLSPSFMRQCNNHPIIPTLSLGLLD